MKPVVDLFARFLICSLIVWQTMECHAQTETELESLINSVPAQSKWMLRTLADVTVNSSIVRLGDVVQPVDPQSKGWARLRSEPIGLIPVNRDTITIDRSRLDRAIRKTERHRVSIAWLGPEKIRVKYPRSAIASLPTTRSQSGNVVPASFVSADEQTKLPNSSASTLNETEFRRITHWITLAIKRDEPKIAESFEIDFDPAQSGFNSLRTINGVTLARPIDTPESGRCRFRIVGRSVDGPIETIIVARLTGLPTVVVPRTTLARGHRITAADLSIAPIATDRNDDRYAVDPSQLVGMEVRNTLRLDRPIDMADVGAPILVHRGDLLEVRVISGGVVVTTNAKALGNGAESDLIEIETMRPKKRVIARVVRTGLVEILTRAPALKYREQSQ